MAEEDNLLLGPCTGPKNDQTETDLEQVYRLFLITQAETQTDRGTPLRGQQCW